MPCLIFLDGNWSQYLKQLGSPVFVRYHLLKVVGIIGHSVLEGIADLRLGVAGLDRFGVYISGSSEDGVKQPACTKVLNLRLVDSAKEDAVQPQVTQISRLCCLKF